MADIKSPAVLWAKGFLFLGLGLLASALLVLEAPSLKVALLLVLAVWAFCRFYYFAFYVIQHSRAAARTALDRFSVLCDVGQ